VWQEGNGLPSGFVRSLVAHLAALNQPVALFSENGEPLVAPFKSKARQLRCFVCDSDFAAGRRVGHFLLVRGHRRVCCFAVFAGGKWERNRIAGLRSVYAESGLHDAVTVCYALSAQQDRDITRRRHASNLRIEQALAGVARRSGVAWRPTPLSDFAATHVAERLDRERIFAALEPSMRRLAKDRGTTAWVGTNDDMAADCLQFLRDQDVGVPEQVSVVGFDDSYLAASCCMTSYGFNGAAAMVRMVDYILRPNTVLDRGAASGTVLVEGAVHERSTTAGVGR
jgi:DNA-binding LacI/PurR family transcriptional regulator